MTPRPHRCAWPDCDIEPPVAESFCWPHWTALPEPIRARICNALSTPPTPELIDAIRAARDWARRFEIEKRGLTP